MFAKIQLKILLLLKYLISFDILNYQYLNKVDYILYILLYKINNI